MNFTTKKGPIMRRRRTRKTKPIETTGDAEVTLSDQGFDPDSKALELLARWIVDWNDVPPRGVS
jgi:hypothetical protein